MSWFRRSALAHEYRTSTVDTNVPWRDVEYLALDFEATGLDLRNDDVISYGAVPIRDARIVVGDQQYALVRPTKPVPPESSKFHVIRNQDLVDAASSTIAAKDLLGLLRGRVLVAHAAWVEVAFLRRFFNLHGATFDSPVIDTASLARALHLRPRIDTHEPHLETLAVELNVPVHDPHHALGDAFTTAQVFLVLAHRLSAADDGVQTAAELVNTSRQCALLRP